MNRLFPEQLTHSLERKLAALYFLVGEDPLLIEESLDAIQQAAMKALFDEKIGLEINASTDWNGGSSRPPPRPAPPEGGCRR